MVPPMFYGEVPEAVILSEYKVPKHLDRVRGDIAESKVYYALKNFFETTGDDVVIIHSHKFLHNASNNEKDFIVFNVSKGKMILFRKSVIYLKLRCSFISSNLPQFIHFSSFF